MRAGRLVSGAAALGFSAAVLAACDPGPGTKDLVASVPGGCNAEAEIVHEAMTKLFRDRNIGVALRASERVFGHCDELRAKEKERSLTGNLTDPTTRAKVLQLLESVGVRITAAKRRLSNYIP